MTLPPAAADTLSAMQSARHCIAESGLLRIVVWQSTESQCVRCGTTAHGHCCGLLQDVPQPDANPLAVTHRNFIVHCAITISWKEPISGTFQMIPNAAPSSSSQKMLHFAPS